MGVPKAARRRALIRVNIRRQVRLQKVGDHLGAVGGLFAGDLHLDGI
jgi:hypothetical protein